MTRARRLRVVLVKPSKYNTDGFVERFRWGSMPNSTLPYMRSLTPTQLAGAEIEVMRSTSTCRPTSTTSICSTPAGHELCWRWSACRATSSIAPSTSPPWRSSAAVWRSWAAAPDDLRHLEHYGKGVSFALSEAELVWHRVLEDAITRASSRSLRRRSPLAGAARPPALIPPSRRDLKRYASRMLGVYPARGCPYRCNFCSIIKIAGHQVRSQPVETTLESLRAAKAAGVRAVFFTSDNFNKYAEAIELLEAMIDETLGLPFFVQCDVQVVNSHQLIELLGRAGCFQMFLGVESSTARPSRRPTRSRTTRALQRDRRALSRQRIATTFANILGFPARHRDEHPRSSGRAARDRAGDGELLRPHADSRAPSSTATSCAKG